VRWFEVDYPATQADKLERIARLRLDAAHVRFVAADFAADPVAELLRAAGLDDRRPALFLLEGVAAYLDLPVLERVLAAFRGVTAVGAPLAISVLLAGNSVTDRGRFREAVARMGEPVRSELTAEQAHGLLAGAGWQVTEGRGRLRSASLLLARATDPAPDYPERKRLTRRQLRPAVPAPVTGPLPISALLSQALVAFTIEWDNEAEHRSPHRTTNYGRPPGAPAAPWLTSLVMWANCLRFLPDEGITVAGLRDLARTGTNLDGMRRWGYLTFAPSPGRGKRPAPETVLLPTARGREAREILRGLDAEIEARWRDRFGGEAGALRSALGGVVAGLDPGLPDCLPILGHGLFSRPSARLPAPAAQPAPPASPDDLPLWALLPPAGAPSARTTTSWPPSRNAGGTASARTECPRCVPPWSGWPPETRRRYRPVSRRTRTAGGRRPAAPGCSRTTRWSCTAAATPTAAEHRRRRRRRRRRRPGVCPRPRPASAR